MSQYSQGRFADFAIEVCRPVALQTGMPYQSVGVKWYGEGVHVHETRQGHEFDADRFEIRAEDLIYNDMWARMGSVAIVPPELSGAVASSHFPTFQLNREIIEPRYLHWFFKTPAFWDECERASRGSTGRNQIKRRTFLEIPIPLPPLAEQRRLLTRIEAIAAQIHEARALRTEIEEDTNAMLAAAHRKISDQAPRKPLIEVAPLNRRPVTVDPEQTYPTVAVRSFGRGTFHREPLIGSEVTWQKPFLVNAGDILVSNIKAWEGALAVAKPDDDGRVGSHRYLTCVPTEGVATARFTCFYLLTPEGLHAVGEASPGSADRNRTLSAKAFMQIPVPVPPFAEQLRFDTLCKEVDALTRLQAETAAELDALLPAILDRAFKGEL